MWYDGRADTWAVEWIPTSDGHPTRTVVAAMLADTAVLREHRRSIRLHTDAGRMVAWARQMLQPGAAAICDTETTDLHGAIVEIAVIDVASSQTLLDTLVAPGEPITPSAHAVHGITDADLAGAPTWPEVLPQLLAAVRGRQILAYNAGYDQGVILTDSRRYRLSAHPLDEPDRWECLMVGRSSWNATSRWARLGGGHRALGDCLAAREVLVAMAQPQRTRARI